ncbi:hypothetical protein [Salipaludibacillus sp. CF4.18]
MNEIREHYKRIFNLSQYRQLVEQAKVRIANPTFDYAGLDLDEAK